MRKRSAAVTSFLAVCLAYYLRLRQRGGSLISPPYCAWRFVSNFDSWNVAYPDRSSIYHVQLAYLNEGDEIRITGSLPYSRYFSYQSYDIPGFVSKSSLRDFEIIPDEGPNLFSNLTAASNREKQGRYTIYITPHGDKNYTNELRALPDKERSGFFVLFLRIYDVAEEGEAGATTPHHHPDADLSCFGPGGQYERERPEEWGWACPPTIAVRRGHWKTSEFKTLRMCRYRRKQGIKLYNDVSEPWQQCEQAWDYNQRNNFFLPRPAHLNGKFGNWDAKYLYSCANASSHATKGGHELWARVSGVLPRTPRSLYDRPLIANVSDYEVRYVSISSVSRSVPYRAYGTLHDRDIIRFYTERLGQDGWDGSYVIWIGPADATEVPEAVQQDTAMMLTWGRSFSGASIPYPSILYRQLLSRGQVLRSSRTAARRVLTRFLQDDEEEEVVRPLPSAVADILPERCGAMSSEAQQGKRRRRGEERSCRGGKRRGSCAADEGGEEEEEEEEEQQRLFNSVCCGTNPPDWCYDPGHVMSRMKRFYPRVDYFLHDSSRELWVSPR